MDVHKGGSDAGGRSTVKKKKNFLWKRAKCLLVLLKCTTKIEVHHFPQPVWGVDTQQLKWGERQGSSANAAQTLHIFDRLQSVLVFFAPCLTWAFFSSQQYVEIQTLAMMLCCSRWPTSIHSPPPHYPNVGCRCSSPSKWATVGVDIDSLFWKRLGLCLIDWRND